MRLETSIASKNFTETFECSGNCVRFLEAEGKEEESLKGLVVGAKGNI